MQEIISKVQSVQNKQKSLKWGSHQISKTQVLFAVGHKEYPEKVKYFIIDNEFNLFLANENFDKDFVYNKAVDINDCVKHCVVSLLKEWYPETITNKTIEEPVVSGKSKLDSILEDLFDNN